MLAGARQEPGPPAGAACDKSKSQPENACPARAGAEL